MSATERRRRTTRAWLIVAAAVLLVNGVIVTTLLTGDREKSTETVGISDVYGDPRASTAVELASAQVLGVVSLDVASDDTEITTMLDRTTATFRTDFDAFVNGFFDGVRSDGLEVRAQVAAAGIADLDDERATVVVATSGEGGRGAEPAQPRDFQMRVSLAWIDDAWRIDAMEFV